MTTAQPNPLDLTTVATLQGYLNPGSNDTNLLQRLITAASLAIENYANRDFVSQNYSKVFDGNGGRVMIFDDVPVTAVSAVTINGKTIPAGSVTAAGYYFTKNQLILNGYEFCRGYGNVAVAYTAGYGTAALGTIPQDLEQFCIGTVQHWLNDRNRSGEVSRSAGGQTITYTQKDMPAWVQTGLNQYKAVFSQ